MGKTRDLFKKIGDTRVKFHLRMDMNLSELRELVLDKEAWRAAIHGVTKSRTRLSHELN